MFSVYVSVVYFCCLYQDCIRWDAGGVFLCVPFGPLDPCLRAREIFNWDLYLPLGSWCVCVSVLMCIQVFNVYIHPHTDDEVKNVSPGGE